MPVDKTTWWNNNFNLIIKLPSNIRKKIHNILKNKDIQHAEQFLWYKLLDKFDLSMSSGLDSHLVYVGGSEFSLDSAWFDEKSKIESKGNWGTVKNV